ncbi:unnamed protein product [Cylicocyclus nassatus]|uniref:Uncharacterized protein n=1 Tax=Cylicocyclus nassatus TaxID=53992 RepID=A0AA36LYU7_CYLNA|nr:unnamed protein product [Cylicocyclus nassatus]
MIQRSMIILEMSPPRCSEPLECCLHGKACRASHQFAEDVKRKESSTDSYGYENLVEPNEQKKTRQEEAIDRLAKHLIHAEKHARRRQKRREERARRRSARRRAEYSDGGQRQISGKDSLISGSTKSYMQVDESAGLSTQFVEGRNLEFLRSQEQRNLQKGDTVSHGSHEGAAASIYLGICNFSAAEESVKKRADFRLYHEMQQNPLLDELEPELNLRLVYKTAVGSYRHYPVETRIANDDTTYYLVNTGEKKLVHHTSLDQLVRYYQINAKRHPDNQEYADPFPWWEVSA